MNVSREKQPIAEEHNTTVIGHLMCHALARPGATALVVKDKEISYAELWTKTQAVAELLSRLGVRPRDRIVLSASAADIGFVFGYLATHALGAVAVPVDPQSPDSRFRYIERIVEPRLIFRSKADDFGARAIIELANVAEELGSYFCKTQRELPNPSSLADVLFTTGTTADPKGVMLTHRNILAAANNINSFIGNTSQDREVVPLPLSHSFGLGRLRCGLVKGGTIVLVDGMSFPGLVTRSLERWNATGLALVPAGVAVLLKVGGNSLLRFAQQLRYLEIGSAPLPMAQKKRLMSMLPQTRICMHYGQTEASRATFIEFHSDAKHLTTVGRASPNVEIRVIDEQDKEAKPCSTGEILVRGNMVMQGYYPDTANETKPFLDNWLRTGDLGWIDRDGYINLLGRQQEIINVGGRKVAPIEVERELDAHESIKQSMCIAIPDPRAITGQAVKAYLVSAERCSYMSADEIGAYAASQLESYKVPVEVEWVDQLPKTHSGKLQRTLRYRGGKWVKLHHPTD